MFQRDRLRFQVVSKQVTHSKLFKLLSRLGVSNRPFFFFNARFLRDTVNRKYSSYSLRFHLYIFYINLIMCILYLSICVKVYARVGKDDGDLLFQGTLRTV